MRYRSLVPVALLLSSAFAVACHDTPAGPDNRRHNPDWSDDTHGRVAPNYAVVFPQAAVNTLEIDLTAAHWAAIKADMKNITGVEFGSGSMGTPAHDQEPMYVNVNVTFRGKQWKNVGFRLKGNSSLANIWRIGNYKLPFRLNFDEFEDRYPGIGDQRFYGFKELSMSPGFADKSLLREKATADIFRMAGVPAARTAFYRVFIDFGEGKKYAGVYTMVEVIDDTMVRNQFGEDAGNIYKPETPFTEFDPRWFEKKNNKGSGYGDVQAMVAALNSPLRLTDAPRWRAGLEATFDVDHFLKYLAVNNEIVNWDSYGFMMAHNFYLYNHSTRKLVWIPWDHNMAMDGNPGITGQPLDPGGDPGEEPDPGQMERGLSLTMNEVTEHWPLIRYLADDPLYFARYKAHMKAFNDAVFTEAKMFEMFDRYHNLISPHVIGANGEQPGYTHLPDPAAFTAGLAELKEHVRRRRALVGSFVP